MTSRHIEGTCHICGQHGPLTFEHIPPRAAFNNRRVVQVSFEQVVRLGPDVTLRGPVLQQGAGGYTLCPRCNNNTGAWYGKWFVDWCYQCMDILIRSNGKPSLFYLNHIFPLRVIKQIVAMFMSMGVAGPGLARFVLDRQKRQLPPQYRFFAYYNTSGQPRHSPLTARASFGPHGGIVLLSEIAYPPLGYVMTANGTRPDDRLVEITHFANYGYDRFVVETLKLPVLPTHLPIPGDYRTKEQIAADVAANRKLTSAKKRSRT